MNYLVTGAAGFIGSRLCERLLDGGHLVKGIDCFTDYYARSLKEANLAKLKGREGFELVEADIMAVDPGELLEGVEVAVHLAAQAGVRRSWGDNFAIYTHNNVLTTQRLLEAAKESGLKRLVYASSSSVYGDTQDLPMRETSACWPVSPYGVSKLAAEHLCGLYYKNFGVDAASLRYFTVYGPRQRPDMAFHRFIRALIEGNTIRLFGDGEQSRDFTFVDDVVAATVAAATAPGAAGQVFNVGGGSRVSVNQVIAMLEDITGEDAKIERLEVAKGDVRDTEADCSKARDILGYAPKVSLAEGLAAETGWVQENLKLLQEA
ncbi:MAG: NAD-dependent epimerase/dehydratase family protein [Desulfarculaceae bacterium]|nr:NAD-dependent epimerase/dehydratase family protein [Desulfarculaceae bacterium]MCF8072257.1 NAD-dependent epimerase/dehydratase family protein [Desulfarculaceae bacterium]MCF8100178.1 NAD-dependent epimerase/dehydratase family protein [Desulfarculaceae bacterium]MCF8117878.1 NAD-dependent epimerase/dehydratase family protein [Desulfarculaceae bacterium]